MNSILIVEDEKLIRLGIRAIAERAPVQIDTILEARNGEEAMAILKERTVDVMFTDIRMPKMNGIALVRELHTLSVPPLTVVISGYDDFSYAVDMLREGVRDYLLKPVERERVFTILKKLDEEIRIRQRNSQNEIDIGNQVFKSLLRDGHIPEGTLNAIKQHYEGEFFKEPFVVICMKDEVSRANQASLYIEDVDGQGVLITRQGNAGAEELFGCAGVSDAHMGFAELRQAYKEALQARGWAFAMGKSVSFSHLPAVTETAGTEKQLDIIVQLLGASNEKDAKKVLGQLLMRMQNKQLEPWEFINGMKILVSKIGETYKAVLPAKSKLSDFSNPLSHENVLEYYTEFCEWIDLFCGQLTGEFDDYQNKRKIMLAVRYTAENYRKGLNMATVSNHVSMNYSLFSHLFKQYTGNNFVNFLQTLRIDESRKLLSSTEMKVNEISARVGFQNEKHFMKLFKATCGVSPGEYRKNARLGKLE